MKKIYSYSTTSGTFFISRSADGRFHPVFAGDSLGSYLTAQQALDDLIGGHTFTCSSGIDTSELDFPEDIEDWEKL